jgi:phosphoglycerate dehydrogenase-like enzyme
VRDPTKPLVVVAEAFDAECVAWLAQRAQVVEAAPGAPAFEPALAHADALVVRTYVRVDEALLSRAPRLRVVGRGGVGLDNIDLEACAAHGIRVVHTPGASTQAVVELVLAFILDDARPRPALDRALDAGEWQRARATHVGERQVSELTLGILGLGRIGSRLARAARGLGMPAIYHDLREIEPGDGDGRRNGAVPVGREELFRRADVLSLHVDGSPANRGLVGSPELACMKPDALLINTSRGFVVQTAALASWLQANPRARAALDVHDPEPFGPDYPLLGLANARLTPHLASGTRTAKRNMSWVVKDVWEALQHGPR